MVHPDRSIRPRRILIILLSLAAVSFAARDSSPDDAPAFSGDRLSRPRDYREWVFVTSGLGMTYGPARTSAAQPPRFDNVFVTRRAYSEFLKSGKWPEGTTFILEVRRSEEQVSIDNGGRTQGELIAIEAAVKDRQRYPGGGWGYFTFDGPDGLLESVTAMPGSASCYSCHRTHGAVDNTFVQFYPTLFDIARRHGTVRPDHDPKRKP
jgi:hypothetical protein